MTDASANPQAKTYLELFGNWISGGQVPEPSPSPVDHLSRKCVTPLSLRRSPWEFETQSATSGSSDISIHEIMKATPKMKNKRGCVTVPTRKTSDRGTSRSWSHKKSSTTPRRRWSLTKKNSSKYSWTGKFDRAKRSIFTKSSQTTQKPREFCSITRTPSPDPAFYYGCDSETEAKVFQLNTTRIISSSRESLDEVNIEHEYEHLWEQSRNFCENEHDEVTTEDYGNVTANALRHRFRAKNLGFNGNNSQDTFETNDLFVNDNDYDDYNNDEFGMPRERYYGNNESDENISFYRKAGHFFVAFIANVLLFGFLPVIYIAIFIYMHGDE